MGRWKLALGIAIVLAIGVWDVGLSGQRVRHTGSAATSRMPTSGSPTVSGSTPAVPDIPGVIQPLGAPEFSATFSGSRLDTSVWSTCYPFMDPTGCTNFGNVHTEDEWYLPSQDQVYGGLLHLVAQREATAGKAINGSSKNYPCRSGMVTSYPGFQFKYGYIQVVTRIPTGAGLWSALWLAAADLKWPPEMDIVEAWGGASFYAAAYFHFSTPAGNQQLRGLISPPTLASGWHTFALSWTETQMTWLLDGKVILTTHQHIPHEKMYLIADLAESISNAHPVVIPGECNGSLLIRSVQVWKT
jgi:beta-glucanase (GH16 family)